MVTVHWYKDRSDSVSASPSVLLDEPRMRRDVSSLARLVAAAGSWGKALRVGEMNTISNNGRRGVSDTLAGALWSLDAMMEVAASGATGVNFHCGRRLLGAGAAGWAGGLVAVPRRCVGRKLLGLQLSAGHRPLLARVPASPANAHWRPL